MFEKELIIFRALCFGVSFVFFLFPKISRAENQTSFKPVEIAQRFEKLEGRIVELENQLADQSRRHAQEITALKETLEIKDSGKRSVYLPPSKEEGPKWLEGLSMGGDLRLRYEGINQNEATRDRNRFRYRFRWKIQKALNKDVDLGFRIVSGSSNDPTATNQTFTGDFNYKDIFLDQAYVKYHPAFLTENISHLTKAEFGGGKVENPFFETSGGLLWDSDVMPEGFYESLGFGFFEKKLNPFVTLGQFILQESATTTDAELYALQSGVRWVPPGFEKESGVQLTHAIGFYDFSDYAADSNFTISGTSLARGNTALGSTNLAAEDFDILQIYNDVKFKVGSLPAKLFADYFTNLADHTPDPDNRNDGYQYGIKLGDAKKKGSWEASYYYGYIEANALVGAFAESDFGTGHANKRGSVVKLGYKLTDFLKLSFGGAFANNVTGADDETRRFQSDLEWIF